MANPDLQPLSADVVAVRDLPGRVNAAIVRTADGDALLIDTGLDKDAGRLLRRACEQLGLEPRAILNTHAHADHFGGNAYLVRAMGLPVFAPRFESAVIGTPELEPVYLFHGAQPPPELRSKWLQAKPSPVDELLEPGERELFGVPLELIDTAGHAHQQLAVRVGEVLIAADALFGDAVLARYPLPFVQNAAKQRESARRLAELRVGAVLPGHGDVTDDLEGLVGANLAAFEAAAEAVEASCLGGSTEAVLAAACRQLGVTLTDLPRYYLNLCTVAAHLQDLRDRGRVQVTLDADGLHWHRP